MSIVGSVHFWLVPWSDLYFSRSIGPFLCSPQGFNLRGVSLCYNFFCLLVSSVSGFRPDTKRTVEDTFFFFLGSLVQSCCGEGGTLQTNITGMCGEYSQCLGHTEFAPSHVVCAFPIYTAQAPGCSAGHGP